MNKNLALLTSPALLLNAFSVSGQAATKKLSWSNLPAAEAPVFRKDTFNIVQFGAVPDGNTLNTAAVNSAIKECSRQGGGVVLVPAGIWLTGPVVMQSNVNLHLTRNALLIFTNDFDQYPLVKGNYEGKPSMRNQSPVSGNNLENIAITGHGVIDGNGDYWRMVRKSDLTEGAWRKKIASGGLLSEDGTKWYPSEKSMRGSKMKDPGAIVPGKTAKDYEHIKDFLRPTLLNFTGCKKILLEGVTFQNSPAWCLHILMCEAVTLRDLFVKNPEYAHNGDGLDLESCKNVVIEGCRFDVGDDGICIKSGKDEAGRERGMPTENVLVRNCIVYRGHGGFVVGSEMSGGARNIFVTDCSFMGTDKGVRFKTTRGRGGVVENIFIKNIYMKDIVDEAIFFDMYYFTKAPAPGEKLVIPPVTEATPQIRNVNISNVVCHGASKGICIRGLPEMNIKNITITDVVLTVKKGAEIIEASDIYLKNVTLSAAETNPLVYVENSQSIVADKLVYNKNVNLLFKVSGERSKNIRVLNTKARPVDKTVQVENGATTQSMILK